MWPLCGFHFRELGICHKGSISYSMPTWWWGQYAYCMSRRPIRTRYAFISYAYVNSLILLQACSMFFGELWVIIMICSRTISRDQLAVRTTWTIIPPTMHFDPAKCRFIFALFWLAVNRSRNFEVSFLFLSEGGWIASYFSVIWHFIYFLCLIVLIEFWNNYLVIYVLIYISSYKIGVLLHVITYFMNYAVRPQAFF